MYSFCIANGKEQDLKNAFVLELYPAWRRGIDED